uniref:Odorant binding protein n=1 Tax=Eogystia hippophaecolus TaxID=1206364 RepID=A0A1B3P5H6_EOGHI|nr:odorant binding protein [Eogystia hippophaecolus]
MFNKFTFVTSFFTILYVTNADPASFITKCKSDDTKCTKESTQKAIPIFADGITELGVEPLDPFVLKKIDASTPVLKFMLSDMTITGLKNCQAKKIQRNVANSELIVKTLCDVDADGHYDMSGQLIILPIEGNGKIHVKLRKLQMVVVAELFDKEGTDGKKHWEIKHWKHSFDLKDKAGLEFENLFNGNEALAGAVRELIASSGNEIITEVGAPVIKAITEKIVQNVQNFFRAVPIEDLALD